MKLVTAHSTVVLTPDFVGDLGVVISALQKEAEMETDVNRRIELLRERRGLIFLRNKNKIQFAQSMGELKSAIEELLEEGFREYYGFRLVE